MRANVFKNVVICMLCMFSAAAVAHSNRLWRDASDSKNYWRWNEDIGKFVETSACKITHQYELVAMRRHAVQLHDSKRNLDVLLDNDGMWVSGEGDTNWHLLKRGSFDGRVAFKEFDEHGIQVATLYAEDACQWSERINDGRVFHFETRAISEEVLHIFDISRDLLVKLDANAMYLQQGDAPMVRFRSGHW